MPVISKMRWAPSFSSSSRAWATARLSGETMELCRKLPSSATGVKVSPMAEMERAFTRVIACCRRGLGDDLPHALPDLLRVQLDPSGPGVDFGVLAVRPRELIAFSIEDHGLAAGTAYVKAHERHAITSKA